MPEQRGSRDRGAARATWTEHLAAAGVEEIRGDCDLGNIAMVKAFERAGYERFARRRSYRITLDR